MKNKLNHEIGRQGLHVDVPDLVEAQEKPLIAFSEN